MTFILIIISIRTNKTKKLVYTYTNATVGNVPGILHNTTQTPRKEVNVIS